ncbi:hypothetical protein ACFJIX_15005 [Roseateles sp. UC29_93]|uniref:hypothetical protein n=1 Tax=Roseateles sp. UC29_93 TaxID=3350177 RepID=UPI00366AA1A7
MKSHHVLPSSTAVILALLTLTAHAVQPGVPTYRMPSINAKDHFAVATRGGDQYALSAQPCAYSAVTHHLDVGHAMACRDVAGGCIDPSTTKGSPWKSALVMYPDMRHVSEACWRATTVSDAAKQSKTEMASICAPDDTYRHMACQLIPMSDFKPLDER